MTGPSWVEVPLGPNTIGAPVMPFLAHPLSNAISIVDSNGKEFPFEINAKGEKWYTVTGPFRSAHEVT